MDDLRITIRAFDPEDWPAVWAVLEPVFRGGDTYPFPADISEQSAYQAWIDLPKAQFVALNAEGRILGTYYIKPNMPGQGAHVCNCGYVTAIEARGRGVASAMCEHSQRVAQEMGFRAMQYNLVVAVNEVAVRLWKRHGFAEAGRLPGAFHHPALGYVDALVMFKSLV